MIILTPAKTQNAGSHLTNSDSEEESSQVEEPITAWNELSIVERVGLNTMQMSEEEIETAFAQIALAFRSDQYTLKQRLQAEEHARNLAEENVQQELSRGRETLETLKALCLDSKRNSILQRLELSLDILGGTVERISNTAEVLGSVHQEARISRAVEIMVAHVDILKRRRDQDGAELEQTKKLVHRISRRNLTEPGAPPDADDVDFQKNDKKICQHYNGRRRVSVSLITKETQEKRKRDSESSCSIMTRDDACSSDDRLHVDAEDALLEASRSPPSSSLDPFPVHNTECPPPPPLPPPEEAVVKKTHNKSVALDTLRQRHRGKAALSKRKADREKKGVNRNRSSLSLQSPVLRSRSLTRWLYRCCWAVLYTALVLVLCAAALTVFFEN